MFAQLFGIAGADVSNAASEQRASEEDTWSHGLAGQLREARRDSGAADGGLRHRGDTENRGPLR